MCTARSLRDARSSGGAPQKDRQPARDARLQIRGPGVRPDTHEAEENEPNPDDVEEVLGPAYKAEAEEAFEAIDTDANGDISLEEMVRKVTGEK